jgi:HEAT repeat protein
MEIVLTDRFIPIFLGLAVVVAAMTGRMIRSLWVRARIKREAAACAERGNVFQSNCGFSLPARTLAAYFELIKKLSRRHGLNFPVLMRLDDYWAARMEEHPSEKLMDRLLSYSPEKGLFPCFLAALTSEKLLKRFHDWVDRSGELMVMATVARSCGGRDFDGARALEAFGDFRDQFFEMTGSPDSAIRWFALRILLHDDSERAVRASQEAFRDSSYRIRQMAARVFDHKDKNELYRSLLQLLLDDPVYEVRRAARERIEKDFADYYAIPPALSHTARLHLTELLNPDIQQDREYAFSLLDGKDEELALEASRVLTRSGSLRRLFRQVFHEDTPSLKRTLHLLTTAARVHSTDFLEVLEESDNPGTLMVAAKLLREYGDLKYTTTLVHRVRGFEEKQKLREPLRSIYLQSLETACIRGDDNALAQVRDELASRRSDRGLHETVLPILPKEHAHVYVNSLFSFLKDEAYPAKEVLRKTLAGLNPELTLSALFDIIKSPEGNMSPAVQEQALRVLCEVGIPYTIQHVLEHLPLLTVERASYYSELLGSHFSKDYLERVRQLLGSSDSRLRSRLISSIPEGFFKDFREILVKALKDSDPEVRCACAWALVKKGGPAEHEEALQLLFDPVEEVRREAARAFAEEGSKKHFEQLKKMLRDETEMIPVKISIVQGLGHSRETESVDVLVEEVVKGGELQPHALKALAEKRNTPMISRILSHIEKLDPRNRALLIDMIRAMGDSAESVLGSFLFDTANPLRETAVEVLERIGTIDAHIRHLANRDASVRREAASFLYRVGTLNAFRGLIQSARDPDEDVRACVVKALDSLDSDRGKSILEELRNDPRRRIRTYTNWALERYRAKRL